MCYNMLKGVVIMKTKQLSPEKLAKKQVRKEKELKYWIKQNKLIKGR